jgi:hypothetical protein
MKKGKWTIVKADKKIIKQYGELLGYIVNDDNFWNTNLNSNIHAIQYTGDNSDFNQVEFNDGTKNTYFSGDIKIFADVWDKEYLKDLQLIWDNNNIYETIPNPNSTPENPKPDITVAKEETTEQKTSRIGPRPISYVSQDIY